MRKGGGGRLIIILAVDVTLHDAGGAAGVGGASGVA